MPPANQHGARLKIFRITQHHRILPGIQPQHVGRLAQGNAQPLTLPHREIRKTAVCTDDAPLYVDKLAFAHAPIQIGHLLP